MSTTFLAVFLIPGFSMGISLAPALAAFLEAAEFGGAMVWVSDLFAGQRETAKYKIKSIFVSVC